MTEVHDLDEFKLNRVMGTYEINGKPIIWQYWTENNVPLYVRLLVEAMQSRNPEFQVILVKDSTIRHYLPDYNIPEDVFRQLIPAHKADLFRVAILRKYGGIYADVDTFVLDKLYPLYQHLKKYDFVTSNWGKEPVAMGAIGPVRANTSLFNRWYLNQYDKVDEKLMIRNRSAGVTIPPLVNYPFGWAEVTLGAFSGILDEIKSNRTVYRGYNGPASVGQLVYKGLEQSANGLWSKSNIVPLKWSALLFLHHSKLKQQSIKANTMTAVMPTGNATTLFTAFVGCALLDCLPEFEQMAADGNQVMTPLQNLNVTELVEILLQLDREICDKLRFQRGKDFTTKIELLTFS
jgi:hypothetical protein